MNSASSLVLTRIIPAARARVFDAWTNAELMKQWFCPSDEMFVPVAEVDAREGGKYRIVMQNKEGATHSPSGVYEKLVPVEQLIFSWKWADSDLVTRVTVDLAELGENETELTLTHEGFPETTIRDRHNEGWTGCLGRLTNAFH